MPCTCPRCGQTSLSSSMSWFTTETICIPCKRDEAGCPNYARARAAEAAALRRGERNYPGIGLAPNDLAYLAERRTARSTPAPAAQAPRERGAQ